MERDRLIEPIEGVSAGRQARAACAWRPLAAMGLAVLLASCASINNDPVNKPLEAMAQQDVVSRESETLFDDTVIALSFSGGGTRAAAFSHGVLLGLSEASMPVRGGRESLVDRIDIISGVSGGAVPAAYYGLKKRAALDDFREKFLLRNAEEALATDVNITNLARGFQGGINDSTRLPRWLDANLFHGATFADMSQTTRPRVSINASDIFNRTPFLFGRGSFGALCSDFSKYPVSLAVAASAAVPVFFAPIVIENFYSKCPLPLPEWVNRVRNNPQSPPMLRQYADAIVRYRDGQVRFVKLLDGGLVDNFGLAGFTISRLLSNTPHGPLSAREGVKLRRVMFLVVDSGRSPSGDWAKTVAGPSGVDLIMATADTATGSSASLSYTAFDTMMGDWQSTLINWRCRLSATERKRLGAPANWNCRDVKFFVTRVGFDQLGGDRAAQLDRVETRFRLPPDQVDMVIAAGKDALNANEKYRAFLRSINGGTAPAPRRPRPPGSAPVAEQADDFPKEATALAPR
jgi:NTE family protein